MRFYRDRIELITDLPTGSAGAEVGVQRGEFSMFLNSIVNPRILHLIDCWEWQDGDYELDPANVSQIEQDEFYKFVLARYGSLPNIRVHKSWSEHGPEKTGIIDWVYLDANHSYRAVFDDLVRWSEVVLGPILGHDFVDNGKSRKMGFGVVEAVNDFCKIYGWKIDALTEEEWSSYRLVRK